jgi:hypothetical protein
MPIYYGYAVRYTVGRMYDAPIGYQTLYQWYIEPPAYGISPLLTHGIYNRLPIVFWFLSMVISNRQSMIYRTHYYGILNPLLMVFWSTHGVSKPSLCYFHITTHDISNPWLWYFSPYPWCIKPSAYGIFNPTMDRNQNTIGKRLYIPWVRRGEIP